MMKDLKDLMTLITKCLEQNSAERNTWFVNFSGHVNQLTISYYMCGWDTEANKTGNEDRCTVKLTEEGIQEAYWFIANREQTAFRTTIL